MMRKKLIGVLMSVMMAVTVLAGCGSGGNGGSSGGDEDGDIVLTMWSIATESDAFNPAYLKAIEDFEAANPGVKINHQTFENESYKTKLKSAVGGNELPDIFFTWGGGFSKSFVEADKVLGLDDYYDDYKADISETVLANATYDGALYGSAIATPVSAMFYNQKMFDEYDVKVPETYEEWKQACQTFIDNGITPIGTSAKDTWVLAMCHDALTLKSAGPDILADALLKQNGQSYDDVVFLDSATKLKELVDMGAFLEGASGLSNDEASQEFYNGKVAMYITGSWMAGSIQTDTENPDDFDVTPVPVLNGDNAQITDFMGGAADTLMAAASTEHPDLAAKAVFEITRGISKYAYLDGAGIPAWTIDYDDAEVNTLTKKVADYAAEATSFTLWFDTLLDADEAGEYLALLQELYIGNLTPEQFVEAMAEQLDK